MTTRASNDGREGASPALPVPEYQQLQQQLLRYAEDLGALLDQHQDLERSHADLVASNQFMRENQRTLEQLLGASQDIHLATDLEGRILQGNPAARGLFRTGDLSGRKLFDLLPDCWKELDAMLAEAQGPSAADGVEADLMLRRNEATLVKLRTQVVRVQRDARESLLHWLMRDSLVDMGSGLDTNLSAMAFLNTAEAIMITDPEGVIVSVNPSFTKITGYSADEVLGRTPRVLNSGTQSRDFYQAFWLDLKEKGSWQGELLNRRKNGELYNQWLNITSARHADGSIASYISVFSDMTPLQETEKRLNFIAYHDALTGLPNRELFLDRLSRAATQSRRSGDPFTLMFIDLDGFKAVNDRLGHETGDQVLQQAAQRLSESVREADTVARLGGDEFVVILPNLSGTANVSAVAHKLINALSAPMLVGGDTVFIGGSVGCAEFPLDSKNEAVLLRHADEAMYAAKQAGGNTHAFHLRGAAPTEPSQARQTEIQFELFYQPRLDISVEPPRLTGVESLLRWHHEDQEGLPPENFLAAAERDGTLGAIDAWALRAGCEQVKAWQAAGLADLTLSVNVSSALLRSPGFIDQVQAVLGETGLRACHLELQIQARDAFSDVEGDQSRLWLLWSLGVHLAIDGIGDSTRRSHCNLLNLKAPPLSRLNIHPSVVSSLREGNESLAVCRSILAIGDAFGLAVTAVGVEKDHELQTLRGLGCASAQGYLLGTPMSREAFAAWAGLEDDPDAG